MKKIHILLFLPPLFAIIFVGYFGVNFPFWDEWEIPLALDSVLTNGLTFGDLWSLHNEHRIFFPAIVYLISAYLTDFNVKANMYISWIFQSGIYLFMLLYLKKLIEDDKRFIFCALCLGFVVFNFVQFENQLWGFQVGFFMAAFFAVSCFYFFDKWLKTENKKYIALSLLFAVMASYSCLQGLFVFPAMIAILIFLDKKKYSFYILLIALLVYAIYFNNFHFGTSDLVNTYSNEIKYSMAVFFNILGAPFYLNFIFIHPEFSSGVTFTEATYNLIFLTGISVFIYYVSILIYLIKFKRIENNIFPLTLICFSLCFAFSIAMARGSVSGFAYVSRYTTFILLGHIGLFLIVYSEFILKANLQKIKTVITSIFSFLLILLCLQNAIIFNLPSHKEIREQKQSMLINYKKLNEQELVMIDIIILKRCPPKVCIELLEKRKWSVFAE